jgi:hypothetical protein
MSYTIENALKDAAISASDARESLQVANGKASAVESLLILQLIERAATLANGIKALQSARGEK